ncbi:ABC transporter permease OS=Streptomyces glaucescens OX=1907 GN=SGLAU_14545 PE=4 SV=1 [Streptomyces glaucescens]
MAAVPPGASVAGQPHGARHWGVKLQGSPLMTTAAASSVTDELTFVVGPLLATALCTAVDPAAGLITEAALTLVGGGLLRRAEEHQPTVTAKPATRA